MIFMVLVSIFFFAMMPYFAKYIAPGFGEDQLKNLISISRIMLLSPIFIGLSNMLGTITQFFKNFFVFSLSPVFYNIGIILSIIILYPFFGLYGLGFGVIIGAFFHLFI